MTVKNLKLFGGSVEIYLETEEALALPLIEEAYELGLRLSKVFNIYDESSELSTLNKQRSIQASKELLEVLSAAIKLCAETGGEYDISHGKIFLQRKSGKEITDLSCTYSDIQITGRTVKLLNDDVLIDLGSIAKGYIADKMAAFLMEQGIEKGYVDARGDIRVFGEQVQVGIQNPRGKDIISTIIIKNKGVATSGDYNQFDKNYSKSHIIRQKELISATVIADNLTDADAFATIIMVCGKEMRQNIINTKSIKAMTVDTDLNVKYYNGFEQLIQR